MSAYLSQEERDELHSLKQDLLGPVKSFAAEVEQDTVGDAKRFYADKARKARQNAALAKDRAKRQAAELRREQERIRQRHRVMVKRTLIVLALIALFCVAVLYAALAAHAEAPCADRREPGGIPGSTCGLVTGEAENAHFTAGADARLPAP